MSKNDTSNSQTSDQAAASVTIEFPCDNYPIKIVGEASVDYESLVLTTVEEHAPGFDRKAVTVRDSRNGRYRAVTVRITATGEPQLKALFESLKQHAQVRMVL